MDEQHRIGIVGAGTNTREMHVPGFRKIRGRASTGCAMEGS